MTGAKLRECRRERQTPAWGHLHGAESWELTTPSVLHRKGQPLSLKYQPFYFFLTFFRKEGSGLTRRCLC